MKILQIIDERWDSGIVNYALNLSKGLAGKGHAVTVAALAGKPPIELARSRGLRVFALQGMMPWLALKKFVRREKPDIIVAHTGRSHAWMVFFLRKGARLIRTRCDARIPRGSLLNRLVINRTHRIIAPSLYMKKKYEEIFPGFPARRIVHVPQGIDTRAFPVFPEPHNKSTIKIGIIGRLDPVKGHRYLIEACARLKPDFPHLRLIIAGKEENVSIETLRAQADACGLKNQVDIVGYVRSVQDVMQACHIGVVASTGSEAVSRAALEWMATGRALIATKVGGLPELISHELTGILVEPADAQALAHALKRIIDDHDFSERMARFARKSIETTFSLKQFVNRTEAVYEDALADTAC